MHVSPKYPMESRGKVSSISNALSPCMCVPSTQWNLGGKCLPFPRHIGEGSSKLVLTRVVRTVCQDVEEVIIRCWVEAIQL